MQVTQFNSVLKLSFQTIKNQKALYLLGIVIKSVDFFILLIITSGPLFLFNFAPLKKKDSIF